MRPILPLLPMLAAAPLASQTRPVERPPLAIVDVSVIALAGAEALEHRTVLVRDGHVVAIGPATSTAVPPDAMRLDGRGRYLVPGLADMHVHLFNSRGRSCLQSGLQTPRRRPNVQVTRFRSRA